MKKNQKETVNVKTVALNDKQSASFLVPDLMEGQQLAVVDENVLQFLTSLLPEANYWDITARFTSKCKEQSDLKSLVACAKNFVAFHETVNLLDRFFDPNAEVTRDVVEKEKSIEELMVEAGYEEEEPGNGVWKKRWDDSFVKMMVDKGYYKSGDDWIKCPEQPTEEVLRPVVG